MAGCVGDAAGKPLPLSPEWIGQGIERGMSEYAQREEAGQTAGVERFR